MSAREQDPDEVEGMFSDEAGQAEGSDKLHCERYGEIRPKMAELDLAQHPALLNTLLTWLLHSVEQSDELQTCGIASTVSMLSKSTDPQ